jgi:hypothetical protein
MHSSLNIVVNAPVEKFPLMLSHLRFDLQSMLCVRRERIIRGGFEGALFSQSVGQQLKRSVV